MPSAPFVAFTSTYVVIPVDNIDTDQIIPARFLTTTERSGLGQFAFADWRRRRDGTLNSDFALNSPRAADARVLVAGRNFGCGSSREHAVWALLDAGVQAIVSVEFADIFRNNALGNGLLPIQVGPSIVDKLILSSFTPNATVSVDLASQSLRLPGGGSVVFPVAPFAKHCLLHGIDEMDFVLGASDETASYEVLHASNISTLGTPLESIA